MRENCFICNTKEKDTKITRRSCTKRNVVYKTWCNTCKVRDEEKKKKITDGGKNCDSVRLHLYIGETCRSAYERGFEHLDDVKQLKPSSHLLKHLLDKHEEENFPDVDFRMEIMAFSDETNNTRSCRHYLR